MLNPPRPGPPSSPPGLLSVDLSRPFPQGPRIDATLELAIDDSLITVLFGPSGSGKTTLLRCLAGLDRPARGHIRLGEETWFDADRGLNMPPQARRIGFLFQDYALFPHLSVAANICFGIERLPHSERASRLQELLSLLELEGLQDRHPHQLSGGQRQRVALARALAIRPRLLLLDEPLSALDGPTRERLRAELRQLLHRAQVPSLLVTHDRLEALTLGDSLVVMGSGKVLQVGPVEQVFSRPVSLEVAQIVGTETVTPAHLQPAEAGLSTARVGTASLLVIAQSDAPRDAFLCIRAEDVLLERAPAHASSARNHLLGRVKSLTAEGPLVRVLLNCGFDLVALVTRQAAEELQIRAGDEVIATIKTSSISVIFRQD